MKIQCTCGAKYAFDVTQDQVQRPVRFVCPACGTDASDFVNQLIRQEFGLAASAPVGNAPAPAMAPQIEVAQPPGTSPAPASIQGESASPIPPSPPRVRLHRSEEKPAEAEQVKSDEHYCSKHPGQRTTETCFVCQKPICPKCMELFGYLCSAACRGKAELQGLRVPVYAGQKALVERRRWRRIGLSTTAACLLLAAFLGVWFWYAWFGSKPRIAYSVRFDEPAYAGAVQLCGNDQVVFLHGGTLARHDMKTKKQIWSRELIDKEQIARQVEQQLKAMREHKAKAESENPDLDIKIPSPDKLAKMETKAAMAALELRVRGQNIWVASPEKLVRYDWSTGEPAQEIPLNSHFGGLIPRGDEFLAIDQQPGMQVITHINLATGQTRDEEIALPAKVAMTKAGGLAGRNSKGNELAGLPTGPAGKDAAKPLDPAKVSEDTSRLSLPGRIALPAVLAINRNQERALAEMNDAPRTPAKKTGVPVPAENFTLIPARSGNVQFAVRLIEERRVTRSAMKAPPKKSALEGAPTVAQTTDIANEILNEMQRDRGGATVTEDESRYQVTIRLPGAKDVPDWTADVIGPPALFPLETVNVLTAGKSLLVFNQQNKKLWTGTLSYPVGGGSGAPDEVDAAYGRGPCVERGDRLYILDQGTLSAFDVKTGNAQWRLPSVGITGLFFDDAGMLYVNTTTASHESLKYSRQIDVSQKTSGSVIKVDPQTGKTLWVTQNTGMISYLSGKFIYSVQSYRPLDEDDENPYTVETGFETKPYLRIRLINPKNGHEMWEYFEQRAPLDVQFEKNSIQVVFKKEVEVLKFLSW